MIKQECVRKSGYSVQADEEQLRYMCHSSLELKNIHLQNAGDPPHPPHHHHYYSITEIFYARILGIRKVWCETRV